MRKKTSLTLRLTATLYEMSTITQLLGRISLMLCLLFATQAVAYGRSNPALTPQENFVVATTTMATYQQSGAESSNEGASDDEDNAVERDFDTIRGFQSYDPDTDKWSTVENFEGVEILEDSTQQREDRYIYRSFWAYDALKNVWYKVDIRDHGYRLGQGTSKVVAGGALEETTSEESPSLWRNWVLGLRIGSGWTYYRTRVINMHLRQVDNNIAGEWFLQTEQEFQDKSSHTINWLGAPYGKSGDPLDGTRGKGTGHPRQKGQKIVFAGHGTSMPITLVTHYTFFDRLRFGGGFCLEPHRLTELRPREDARGLKAFKVRSEYEWFYHMAWFGLIGYKMIHEPKQDYVVDIQVGQVFNRGTEIKRVFDGKKHYIYKGWLFSLGINYERKLNNYFRFVGRLAGDLNLSDFTPTGLNDDSAKVALYQTAAHLDLGINFNFGKDPDEEREDTDGGDTGGQRGNKKDGDKKKKNDLKKLGRDLKKAKSQRDRLGSKLKWNTLK